MKNPHLLKNTEAFVASMEELIRRYEQAIEHKISKYVYEARNGMHCLLCKPLGVEKTHFLYLVFTGSHREACAALGCPWMVMLGVTCDEAVEEGQSSCYQTRDPAHQKARIAQLQEWIQAYQNVTPLPATEVPCLPQPSVGKVMASGWSKLLKSSKVSGPSCSPN